MPVEFQFIVVDEENNRKYYIIFYYSNGDSLKLEVKEIPDGIHLQEHYFIGCYQQNYVHLY